MPNLVYRSKRFSQAVMATIVQAVQIINEYAANGYDLTLRQLYYQFVSKALISNEEKSYKRLGSIINDARLAGLIDWDTIVDRTRHIQENTHWEKPKGIIETCVEQYQIEKWATQPERVEVWIEKDALVGVIARVCSELDVPYFSCRGYSSQSEMWRAAKRITFYQVPTTILHLGDHDPSGIDMTRDIQDRLEMFTGPCAKLENIGENNEMTKVPRLVEAPRIERLALNMNQIRKYKPPPNPTKFTDPRSTSYRREFGSESWELDALEPSVIEALVRKAILKHRDEALWKKAVAKQDRGRKTLGKLARSMK